MLASDEVDETRLMRLLADRTVAPVAETEQGELPFELARAVTAPFIVSDEYGTRCSTVLTWTPEGDVAITERRFDASGAKTGETGTRFKAGADQSGA